MSSLRILLEDQSHPTVPAPPLGAKVLKKKCLLNRSGKRKRHSNSLSRQMVENSYQAKVSPSHLTVISVCVYEGRRMGGRGPEGARQISEQSTHRSSGILELVDAGLPEPIIHYLPSFSLTSRNQPWWEYLHSEIVKHSKSCVFCFCFSQRIS